MNAPKCVLSKVSRFAAARNSITPLQSRCCGAVMATDAWDETGITSLPHLCLAAETKCPFYDSRVPLHESRAPIELDTQIASGLFIFFLFLVLCLGPATFSIFWTMRGLYKAYKPIEKTIKFYASGYQQGYILPSPPPPCPCLPPRPTPPPTPPTPTPPTPPPPPPPPRSETEILRQELRLRQYELRNVKGDGNCMFRAVAYQFSGTEDLYPQIRECAVHHMRTNPDHFMPFVSGPYQDYLAYMATDRTYGTQAEIVALSNGLGRPVRVWQAEPKMGTLDYHFHGDDKGNAAGGEIPIDIAYHAGQQHYYVVQPIAKEANGGTGAFRQGEAASVEGTGTTSTT